jgi:hypothetical protein
VLVKPKALHPDAFFQIITGRVINTHFILSQQKGDRMGSDLEEEEVNPSPVYHAVTTSTMSTTFSIETIFLLLGGYKFRRIAETSCFHLQGE